MKKPPATNHYLLFSKKGFTFIEMLVVVAIIGVLASIGVAVYSSANKKSRDGKRKADIEQIRSALEMYRAENGDYPTTAEGLSALESDYINEVPHDPKCPAGSCATGFSDYSYSSDGSTYTLSADLESNGVYSKSNP